MEQSGPLQLIMSSSFIREISRLPYYLSIDPGFRVDEQWLDFFLWPLIQLT